MIATQPTAFQAVPASSVRARPARSVTRFKDWVSRHPVLTITLVSVIAVVVNCYPIIFCGRSFVSPASVTSLVYDWWPPAPTMDGTERHVPQHESDTGAMMWWDVPIGFL